MKDPTFKGASFFNWVFIGKSINENRELVLDHEFAHSGLRHSIDILLSHLYCAFFWINPFAWVLKKSVAINTELETDAQITQDQDSTTYANLLLDLSKNPSGSTIMNHFSAKHLKMRIMAMKNTTPHRKWVYYFTTAITFGLFFLISCTTADLSNEISAEARLYDVKTITTYFTSHQSDTQQKTGKMVSRATFLPDGELDELVNKSSYPYDREYERKRVFWQPPIKKNLPYIMDGLPLGIAERNLLYGNDWPTAFAQHLLNQEATEERRFLWKKKLEIDNIERPNEIASINVIDTTGGGFVSYISPNTTTFYEYEGNKVSEIFSTRTYPEINPNNKLQKRPKDLTKKSPNWKELEKITEESGKKIKTRAYTYEGENLTSIVFQGFQKTQRSYQFYYEGDILTKSEYYIQSTLINTRMHYFENGLKRRAEIFNIDNEHEYTINYEYEFWD